ncbi:MAG: hypothetical protein M3169_00290 [Candidatus Eremiobacteraeota bacterium]|nr:hypothetical protein [Candidatus Eremiobacteraeota bacterium]
MNLVILVVSALLAFGAAANAGSPKGPAVTTSTSAGVTAAPTPSPSPAPPTRNDVINGGGPT